MTEVLVTVGALVIFGIAPAVALAGADLSALALAPLMTALLASAAGLAALATRTPLLPWAVVSVVAANTVAASVLYGRRIRVGSPIEEEAVVLAAAAYPLLGLRGPDAGWDARSIWFLHARWFYAGGAYLHRALGNPAYLFAHPDYPPLIPATTAALWRAGGAVDMRVAQAAVTTLNVAAVCLIGAGFLRLRGLRPIVTLVGAAMCLAAYNLAGSYTVNGYADLLWAASAAAALLYLLLLPPGRSEVAVGLVCAATAALTKNEGIPVVAAVLGLAAVRHRAAWPSWFRIPRLGRWSWAVPAAVAVAVLGGWTVLARQAGARSDLFGGPSSGGPLAASHDTWARLSPTWHSVWVWCKPALRLAAAASVLGVVFLRGWRRRMGVGNPMWSALVIAIAIGALVGAYVASPYDLGWHLGTSLDRTTIAPRLLLMLEVGLWAVFATSAAADQASSLSWMLSSRSRTA